MDEFNKILKLVKTYSILSTVVLIVFTFLFVLSSILCILWGRHKNKEHRKEIELKFKKIQPVKPPTNLLYTGEQDEEQEVQNTAEKNHTNVLYAGEEGEEGEVQNTEDKDRASTEISIYNNKNQIPQEEEEQQMRNTEDNDFAHTEGRVDDKDQAPQLEQGEKVQHADERDRVSLEEQENQKVDERNFAPSELVPSEVCQALSGDRQEECDEKENASTEEPTHDGAYQGPPEGQEAQDIDGKDHSSPKGLVYPPAFYFPSNVPEDDENQGEGIEEGKNIAPEDDENRGEGIEEGNNAAPEDEDNQDEAMEEGENAALGEDFRAEMDMSHIPSYDGDTCTDGKSVVDNQYM